MIASVLAKEIPCVARLFRRSRRSLSFCPASPSPPRLAPPVPTAVAPSSELAADTVPLDSPAGARIRKGPVVARNDDRFGVAWIDERSGSPEVHFAGFDAAGNRIGEELRVDTGYEEPSLAETVNGFTPARVPNMVPFSEIRLEALTAGGAPLGPARVADRTSDQDHFASLASTGNELGFNWRNQQPDGTDHHIHFARFALDGTPIGSETVVSDRPEFEDRPMLAWNGREYGVAWIDRWKRVLFARLSPEGVRIGEIRTVTDEAGALLFCDIARGGDEWGIVANPDDRIVFRRVSATRNPVASPIDLGHFRGFPSLA